MKLPAWLKPLAPLWPLLPALLAVMVYLPALSGGFVYDDGMIISDNRFTQDGELGWLLSPEHYYGQHPESLGGSMEQSYRPLGTALHMLECDFFWNGSAATTHAGAFRLTSVYLHALNALLICALAWRLLGISRLGALAAGLCFALHPVATEAILVASFREDLLCLFFLLVGLLAFAVHGRRDDPSGLAWSGAGAAAFLAAMLCKEVGLVALPLAACAEWCAPAAGGRPRPLGRTALRYGMIVAATGCFLLLRFWLFQSAMEKTTPFPGGALGDRWSSFWTMLPVFQHYLGLFFAPITLQADYMIPVRWSPWQPDVFRAVCLLAAAVALGVVASRYSRPVRFGLLAALLALGPVTNVIPIRNICAERYLYVPLAGMALAGGALLAWVWIVWPGRRRVTVGVLAVLALLAAVRTLIRIPQWHSNDAIWAHTVGSQVLTHPAQPPFPPPPQVRGPFWTPAVEPLSTRGHMAVAGMYHRLATAAQARELDAGPLFQAELVHCLALVGVPWRVPKPGHEGEVNPPMVEVFSDAQASTRFHSAFRILAEMRWIEYERFPEAERTGPAAQERLRQSREAVERCIRLYEREVEKGDPDFGMYDLRGRVYHALNGNEWREWWSVRDRAYAAQRDAERLMRRGQPAEAAPRWQDGVVHNRRALELMDDPAYRKRLSADQQRDIEALRWSVTADLANCLLALEQSDEASQLFGIARDACFRDRERGGWKLADAHGWASIARGVQLSGEAPQGPWKWSDVQGRPDADTILLAVQVLGAPDPKTAGDEARRFEALGFPAVARYLSELAAAAPPAEVDPEEPWSVPLDRLRYAQAAGEEPTAATVQAARDHVLALLQQPKKPFWRSWERAFARWNAHQTQPSQALAERAASDLRRARWLATADWYAAVAAPAGHPERRKMALDLWNIEYDLWWWYHTVLAKPDRARSHAQAGIAPARRATRRSWRTTRASATPRARRGGSGWPTSFWSTTSAPSTTW
ncbi:MAG: hypothetical protein ACYTGX_09370 [Planctomycetota bacterium]